MTKEEIRLAESGTRKKHWKRWGPYISANVQARQTALSASLALAATAVSAIASWLPTITPTIAKAATILFTFSTQVVARPVFFCLH